MSTTGNNYWSALRVPLALFPGSGARTNVDIPDAYVHGTSGPAVALRYQARTTGAITEVYFFMDDFVGTLASITLGCAIYREHASSVTQPVAGAAMTTASSVSMPSAADKWIKVTFPGSYSPAIGETVWVVLYNTSSSPTINYPSIMTLTSIAPSLNGSLAQNTLGYSTTAGFSTAGTPTARLPFVIIQGGEAFGQPITASTTSFYPAATTTKGFQIKPPCNIEVSGWAVGTVATGFSGIRIYDNNYGSSPVYSFNLGSDANQSRDELIGSKIFSPIILQGGVTYNVVATYATATAMTTGYIEDYASYPSVFDFLVDNFMICPAVSDTGSAWSVRKDAYPNSQLLVTGFPMTSRASYQMGV